MLVLDIFFWSVLQEFLHRWSYHLWTKTVLFFSFAICTPFISFPCLTALVRACSMVLKSRGEGEHSCLAPDLDGKALSFSPLSMTLAIVFLQIFVIKLRKFLSILGLLRGFFFFFHHKWALDFVVIFLHLLIWPWILLCWLVDVMGYTNFCTSGINPTWLCCVILFKHCWMWFADVL